MLAVLTELLGRFHPLIVHLPIGILLLGALLLLLTHRTRYAALRPALPLSLGLGALSALLACATGWLLADGGDYDPAAVNRHRWAGIGLALLACGLYWYFRSPRPAYVQTTAAALLSALLLLSGHFGGSLTHGEDYLSAPFRTDNPGKSRPLIADIQSARLYPDLVEPLLEEKCFSCHSSQKQKGGLRLDSPEALLKGGKNGSSLSAGQPDDSELYRRLVLEPSDEHHMPPKGKPQLSEGEIALIHWWIESGASFDRPVRDFPQPEPLKAVLASFQNRGQEAPKAPELPEKPVSPAAEADLAALRRLGVLVMPVAQNSNYLQASFINAPQLGDASLELLLPLAKQLVWLKLGSTQVSDKGLALLPGLSGLTRLSVEQTDIGDPGMVHLAALPELRYLNLSATSVTADGIRQLKDLKKLEAIYLFGSPIKAEDWPELQKLFPKVHLDSGGYSLPLLPGDTSELR